MAVAGDIFEIFNAKLLEFIDDISAVYKDSKKIKKGITLAILVDRKMPIRMFKEKVVIKYGDQISTRNEAFLMEEDYTSSIANVVPSEFSSIDIVNELKSIWKSLDDDNKNAIWAHIQGLCALAKRMPASSSSVAPSLRR